MKIVINRDFGGFKLSKEAYEFLGIKYDEEGYTHFLHVLPRDDEKLVECIETLGKKACDNCHLVVVEIPDDVDWYIEEYDGKEWVAEEHREWGKDL